MRRSCRRQQGAFLLTVALSLLFLLGFMGISLDFARLFVIRGELQTALDSCALAAARELDQQSSAIARARAAGVTAGRLNPVNFQRQDWAGQALLGEDALTFYDKNNSLTTEPAQAVYARCAHRHTALGPWLLPAFDAFAQTQRWGAAHAVQAFAVARRASAQSSCPMPLALRPRVEGDRPDYGFVKGEWVTLLTKAGLAPKGQIGWANLDGSNNAAETERELRGFCGSVVGDRLGTPGVQSGVADAWNLRFGILKSKDQLTPEQAPDLTGYAYTRTNWKPQRNAYGGPVPTGGQADPSGTAENYQTKAGKYASCADNSSRMSDCEKITGLKIQGGFSVLAEPGLDPQKDGHYRFGAKNRRVVIVPVVSAQGQVLDYACMLLLQPLGVPLKDVELEYIGNAGAADSPCTTSGLPGGVLGPLVPTLVR